MTSLSNCPYNLISKRIFSFNMWTASNQKTTFYHHFIFVRWPCSNINHQGCNETTRHFITYNSSSFIPPSGWPCGHILSPLYLILCWPCSNIDHKRCKKASHHGWEEGSDDHRESEEGHILPEFGHQFIEIFLCECVNSIWPSFRRGGQTCQFPHIAAHSHIGRCQLPWSGSLSNTGFLQLAV